MGIIQVGERRFYIWAEIKKKSEEYDVWVISPFLPLVLPEPLYQDEESFKRQLIISSL